MVTSNKQQATSGFGFRTLRAIFVFLAFLVPVASSYAISDKSDGQLSLRSVNSESERIFVGNLRSAEVVEQGTSPSSQIILVDQLSRPTLVWTALAGNMRLEYAANGRLSRLVALDRDRTVEPLYSENGHSVTTLRTLKSSDGSHVSDVNLQRLAGESLKYVLAIEDDEYVRQVLDFGQEYLDLLMRNMGFDFDLNRTPRERDQCIAACEQTCSDGTTAYGTVITVAGIVAPPSAVIGGALFLGLIALDYTCRSNCKSSWRCR